MQVLFVQQIVPGEIWLHFRINLQVVPSIGDTVELPGFAIPVPIDERGFVLPIQGVEEAAALVVQRRDTSGNLQTPRLDEMSNLEKLGWEIIKLGNRE